MINTNLKLFVDFELIPRRINVLPLVLRSAWHLLAFLQDNHFTIIGCSAWTSHGALSCLSSLSLSISSISSMESSCSELTLALLVLALLTLYSERIKGITTERIEGITKNLDI